MTGIISGILKENEMNLQYRSLTIRTAVPSDAAQLTAWWNDGSVMAHAGFPNGLGTIFSGNEISNKLLGEKI